MRSVNVVFLLLIVSAVACQQATCQRRAAFENRAPTTKEVR